MSKPALATKSHHRIPIVAADTGQENTTLHLPVTFIHKFPLLDRLRVPSPHILLILCTVSVLLIFGLLMVLSSSFVTGVASGAGIYFKFLKQTVFAVLGLGMMYLTSKIPADLWFKRKTVYAILLTSFALQFAVFTPLGVELGGNRAWLNIGPFSMQPAELMKFALCLWIGFMADFLGPRGILSAKKLALGIGVLSSVGLLLVLAGKDLGTFIILLSVVIGALFFAGVRVAHLFVVVASSAALAVLMAVVSPVRVAKITAFFGGHCDYEGLCWQTTQGFFAIARGGIFGAGFGNSAAKWHWLPEADNDFIFAIIAEEFGFIGAIATILLFVFLAILILGVWNKTTQLSHRAFCGGLFTWIMFQAFVNIAVVLGLLPVLGVPLPLISSGGSALVATLCAFGVLISIAKKVRA